MYKVVGDLHNKGSRPIPNSDYPCALANEIWWIFICKDNKIHNEVDSLGSCSSVGSVDLSSSRVDSRDL